jgi:ADP-heptose:LPS heptosyltransferase
MSVFRQPDGKKPSCALLFPGALGDFVCLLPTLWALGQDTRVDVFAKTDFVDLVPPNASVGALERYEINRLFVAGGAREARVREFFSRYDSVYSWMGSRQPVFAGELDAAARGRVRLFDFRGAPPAMHQTDYYLSCLGFSPGDRAALTVSLRPEALDWRRAFWARHALKNSPVLVVAPGSGAREKNWPAPNFAAVARWWRERTGGAVIVLLGPVEEERGGNETLADNCITARNLSLAQVAALLSRADLYLGNDSGVTHLAAAAGAPTVAIFGPSDPQCWAPRGAKVLVLRLGVACSPCAFAVMKECPHRQCLTGFFRADIIRELEQFAESATLTWVGAGITVSSESCQIIR